ncbi:MAG TPA: hypothetical protein VHH09_02225 [Acidimicrobiales bacterium]|nr:hypothetical protein [Acidimicrobiales bacterium]
MRNEARGIRSLRPLLAAVVVAAALAVWTGTASAEQTITSAGPLTSIRITDDLNCAVNHASDTEGEFFGDTACATQIAVGGTVYGPESIPAGNSPTPFTPVSQSAVTGTGSASDPFTITTVVDVGTTGLRITQTDSYVVGQESYRTDVQIANTSGSPQSVILYRAGDCFLQNSDDGFGRVDPTPAGNAVACVAVADPTAETPTPGTRIEQWLPITPGSHYFHAGFSEVWGQVSSAQPFPDTCRCDEFIDNGAGLSWELTVPAGGSVTVSHLTTFSPEGNLPLTVAKTADQESVAPGASDGYTITVSNATTAAVTLDSITDTLPAGFTYVAGSSTGLTTADPAVSGQTLTWSGPLTVPAATATAPGTATLHFGVTVSDTPGTYTNRATAAAAGLTVVPTGDTAPITVGSGGPTTTVPGGSTTTTTPGGSTTTTTPGGSTTTTTRAPGSTTTTTRAPASTTTTVVGGGHGDDGGDHTSSGPLIRTGGDFGRLLVLGALALFAGAGLVLSGNERAVRRAIRRHPW